MAKRCKFIFYEDVKEIRQRFFIKRKALELGLKGYCTFNTEGQLVVEVEGRTAAVDEFILFFQKGRSHQASAKAFTLEIFKEIKGYTAMESDIV